MRAHSGTNNVESILRIFRPGADSLVGGVFQRSAARLHAFHPGAEHFHTENIESLPCHILFSHVHCTFHAEKSCACGRCHAVLSRAGLGNDLFLSHSFCQKNLSNHVVDLMSASMIQIFPFQINFSPIFFRQFLCQIKRRFPSHIIFQVIFIFFDKFRIFDCLPVCLFQLL